MKNLTAICLLFLSTIVTRAADPVLQPVADHAPILQELQRKMSTLRSWVKSK